MGKEVAAQSYSHEERQRYREKVRQNLDVFERMLKERAFDEDEPLTGLEIELNLIDDEQQPAFVNHDVLEAIADPEYQTELAQFNIELNVAPRALPGDSALRLEESLRASLNRAEGKAREAGARIISVGILPTIRPEHYSGDWISANNRYTALNDSIFVARGEDIVIDIEGPTGEHLHTFVGSIAPESACTSVQLHLQVGPGQFADHWNAAQVISAPQLALAANSPFFFGRRLHAETRIALFSQATDTRPIELKNQGVRPRVFFGERWITSIFDLFEENVRYYPALLAEATEEDPVAVLDAGGTPKLGELNLHNGTVYRWNRPIYDPGDDRPHVRVENRVLPAGPSIIDTLANAAFYYGCVRTLAREDRPIWTRMSFPAAQANFETAARDGLGSRLYWPGHGEIGADELVLRHLLPLARRGLEDWGVSESVINRYLGVIEGRCTSGVNGAVWQTECVHRLEEGGLDRAAALAEMTGLYTEHMHRNDPVHTWPLP